MTKIEAREMNQALALLSVDARIAAVSLACLYRSARNAADAERFAAEIESRPALLAHLQRVNGCYVPA